MRKTVLFTISLAFLVILPATAQVKLGNVWTDFQYYAVDLQNYLKNNIADSLKPAEYESQAAMDDSTGQLNIPDPIAATDKIRDDIIQKSISDTFENNAAVEAMTASNEINRQITRGAIEGFLGGDGQLRVKDKLQNIQNSINNIAESVKKAEENKNLLTEALKTTLETACENSIANNTTQCQNLTAADLQLQSIKIQSEQAKMIGETLANTIQVNQTLQYSNLNLANISQQMEQFNRARRVDSSAEAAQLLRATSQIDLLGDSR